MKKILIVIHAMKGGGAERVVSILLRHIYRRKYDPKLVLFEKTGDYLSDLPYWLEIIDLKKRNKWDVMQLISGLRCVIRKESPDIIVSVLDYANVLTLLACVGVRMRPRIVISERSYHRMYLPHARMRYIRTLMMRFVYKRADRIIAISNGIKKAITEDFNVDPRKIDVIYNPIDIDGIHKLSVEPVSHRFFSDKERHLVIISAGRLAVEKNFEFLLRVLKELRTKRVAYLIIMGQGDLFQRINNLAINLGVKEYVDFVGFQRNPFAWISKSDVFVLSSLWEGLGNVIIEAMACGTPVIAADCPVGPREIIRNSENGILVPFGDTDAMVAAILEMSQNAVLRDRVKTAALKFAEEFDIANILPRYWRVLESCGGAI